MILIYFRSYLFNCYLLSPTIRPPRDRRRVHDLNVLLQFFYSVARATQHVVLCVGHTADDIRPHGRSADIWRCRLAFLW